MKDTETHGEPEDSSQPRVLSSRRRHRRPTVESLAADPPRLDLSDSGELPTESLERYNRPFESGVGAAVLRSSETRRPARRSGQRVRLTTSTSASNGWAARFSKLRGVKLEAPEEE